MRATFINQPNDLEREFWTFWLDDANPPHIWVSSWWKEIRRTPRCKWIPQGCEYNTPKPTPTPAIVKNIRRQFCDMVNSAEVK